MDQSEMMYDEFGNYIGPELESDDSDDSDDASGHEDNGADGAGGAEIDINLPPPSEDDIWEDKDIKSFYENLADLSVQIHPKMLQKSVLESESQAEKDNADNKAGFF